MQADEILLIFWLIKARIKFAISLPARALVRLEPAVNNLN